MKGAAHGKVEWRRLGEFIEECDERNKSLLHGIDSVMGMNLDKDVIPTKANLKGNDLANFKVVHPEEFIYNPRTHGKRIGLGYNDSNKDFLISWNNAAFRIRDKNLLLPLYLYVNFLRSEWDREACYQSWGSSTEVFSWKALCRMSIPVPSIDVQRNVVETWHGLRKMKEENEKLVEPLLALCRSYLQDCKKKYPMRALGDSLIAPCDERNASDAYGVESVRGVNIVKDFMPTAANIESVDLRKYKIVRKGRFVFSGMQTGRDGCIRIALSNGDVPFLVSPAYDTFEVSSDALLPEYLHLLFLRPEMDRLGWFLSDSSVRANLDWNRFCEIKIPLPPIEVQQAVVDVYRCANEAKRIAEEADRLSREICPALVRWAAEGGR